MNKDIAIKVENVSKTFKLPHEKRTSIKSVFVNFFRRQTYEKQKVLDDISFEIKKGEFFGIVGRNGSGKSTLLKLLANIYTSTKGDIYINGSLTPFIELGVGFNPELTGRENVFLNGALLGFSNKEMTSMYGEIVEFAELNRFMDQKLKNYSSGMQVRLAFSIAIRAKSDILLLDEVLAVGDALFQKKCYDYFKELKRMRKTVIFVSHDSGALQEYCTQAILLDQGKLIEIGKTDKIIKTYTNILNETERHSSKTKELSRWGSGKAEIISTKLNKENAKNRVHQEEDAISISTTFKAKEDIDSPVCGVTINDLAGNIMFQTNTLWKKQPIRDLKKSESVTITWTIPNFFNTGKFTVSPAVSDSSGTEVYDWQEDVVRFEVEKEQKSHGFINSLHKTLISYDSK